MAELSKKLGLFERVRHLCQAVDIPLPGVVVVGGRRGGGGRGVGGRGGATGCSSFCCFLLFLVGEAGVQNIPLHGCLDWWFGDLNPGFCSGKYAIRLPGPSFPFVFFTNRTAMPTRCSLFCCVLEACVVFPQTAGPVWGEAVSGSFQGGRAPGLLGVPTSSFLLVGKAFQPSPFVWGHVRVSEMSYSWTSKSEVGDSFPTTPQEGQLQKSCLKCGRTLVDGLSLPPPPPVLRH